MEAKEREKAVGLWATMFKDDNIADVTKAVKDYINTSEFPPTIADIRKRITDYKIAKDIEEELKNRFIQEQKWIEEQRKKMLQVPEEKIDYKKNLEYIAKLKAKIGIEEN